MQFIILLLFISQAWPKVEVNDRAAVFVINTQVSDHPERVDKLGKFMVSPWVNAKYDKVIWMLSGKWDDHQIDNAWRELFTKYKVIDYFSYVHTGDEFDHFPSPEVLKLKRPGQLRLVYTTACYSEDSREFVENHGAAAAIGHKALSDSTLFSMSFVRKWVKGNTLKNSITKSYRRGKRLLKFLGPMELREHLFTPKEEKQKILEDSEMSVSFREDEALESMTIESESPLSVHQEIKSKKVSEH